MNSKILSRLFSLPFVFVYLAWIAPIHAADVNIVQDLPAVDFGLHGKSHRIQRIQNQENRITGGFAKTSRKCPPFCIQKMTVIPGVRTAGELEVLEFLKNKVEKGNGILVDARTPAWYKKGTIPGSTNIPFTQFDLDANDPGLRRILKTLGVKTGHTVNWSDSEHLVTNTGGEPVQNINMDFSNARELMFFCNGPWCGQSPRAIKSLVKLGYPLHKIHYYRGGMQLWLLLGLSVTVP